MAAAWAAPSSGTSCSFSAISNPSNITSAARLSTPFLRPVDLVGACQNALGRRHLSALSAQLAGLSSTCTPLSNFPGSISRTAPPETTPRRSPARNSIFSGVGRLDYRLNDKNSINGLFFMSPGNGTFVDDAIHEIAPQWLTTQYARSQVISGNWVYVATPTVVNSLRIGVSRYHQIFGTPDVGENPDDYSYNGSTYHFYTGQTDPTFGGFPRIQINGFPSFSTRRPRQLAEVGWAGQRLPVQRFSFDAKGQTRHQVRRRDSVEPERRQRHQQQ